MLSLFLRGTSESLKKCHWCATKSPNYFLKFVIMQHFDMFIQMTPCWCHLIWAEHYSLLALQFISYCRLRCCNMNVWLTTYTIGFTKLCKLISNSKYCYKNCCRSLDHTYDSSVTRSLFAKLFSWKCSVEVLLLKLDKELGRGKG